MNIPEIEKLKYLYENNIQVRELSACFKRSPSTIHRIITKLKLQRKSIEKLLESYQGK